MLGSAVLVELYSIFISAAAAGPGSIERERRYRLFVVQLPFFASKAVPESKAYRYSCSRKAQG